MESISTRVHIHNAYKITNPLSSLFGINLRIWGAGKIDSYMRLCLCVTCVYMWIWKWNICNGFSYEFLRSFELMFFFSFFGKLPRPKWSITVVFIIHDCAILVYSVFCFFFFYFSFCINLLMLLYVFIIIIIQFNQCFFLSFISRC